MRANDVTVNDTPLVLLPQEQRTKYSHSILAKDKLYSEDVHIPLNLEGVTSYFNTRTPTQAEIQDTNNDDCTHVNMTASSTWDPHDVTLSNHEASLREALLNDEEPRLRGRGVRAAMSGFSTPASRSLSHCQVRSHRAQISRIRSQQWSPTVDVDSYASELERVSCNTVGTKKRKGYVGPEELAKRWHIGLETARKTLDRTTQLAVRDFTHTMGGRRLKPIHYQLKYRRLRCEMYVDIYHGKCKSLRGNNFATVYCTPFHWICFDPMESKGEAHKTLDTLFQKIGIPSALIPDNAKELTQGEFKRKALRASCPIHPIEPYTSNANICEDGIRETLRGYRRMMSATNTPGCLWDDALQYYSQVRCHTVNTIHETQGEVPQTLVTGDDSDISYLCEFDWYSYVWYLDPEDSGMERKKLGKYCGPFLHEGDAMAAKILTEKATQRNRTSVFRISPEEARTDAFKQKAADFEIKLKEKLKDRYNPLVYDEDDDPWEVTPMPEPYEPIEPEETAMPELADADEMQHEAFDRYITARVCVPQGDKMSYGTVIRRKRDIDGELVGNSSSNPILDTSIYEVEFDSGETEAYTANIIAEHIYSQVDEEGYTHYMLNEIIDHRKDDSAVSKEDGFVITKSGRKYPRRTTKGWQFCCKWNDESTSWHTLKDVKESHLLQVAQYAIDNGLVDEPAFAWWVPHTVKKRDRIIRAMKKRYFRIHQKYGIQIPKSVQEARDIDRDTGTTFWMDAIRKEMKNCAKAFEILPEGSPIPVGHTHIDCHMIFDVKHGTLQRKARYVAGGHMTDPPASITYASVVSRESVRIAFVLAALNGLDIEAADIGNAYLNAPTNEKIVITCGEEFGAQYKGRLARIVRAQYGLKGSGAAWRSHLAKVLYEDERLGFKMCKADNDVWYRPAIKPDGTKYYEYILVYTDDILCLSVDPQSVLDMLDQRFLLKPESRGHPKVYLGADIGKWTFEETPDQQYWSMGSQTYVKESIRNVENYLERKGKGLKQKVNTVLPNGYVPELDVSTVCDEEEVGEYHQRIGILRWIVELGRVDICTEVSMMAAHCAMPRKGHLEAVWHMFAYLKRHDRSRMVFDARYPKWDANDALPRPDWTEFYKDVKEQIPPDAPEPRGMPIEMTAFVDSDHAADTVTRRSRTGIFIYIQSAPIIWFSKKQTSIETSSFGSEFSAMKTAVEMVEGLRYKLRMMGVPIDGPCRIKADNMSMVKNSSVPESQLKKKSNSIAFHYARERAAAGVIVVQYEPSESNIADMLTKTQSGPKRRELAGRVLY